MKSKEQRKLAIILSYLNMLLGLLISILYTPFMLRMLGKSEYGLYNLASSFVSYLGLFDFGFSSSYIRFFSRYSIKNDEKALAKLNGIFMLMFSAIGMLTLIAGSILVVNLDVFYQKKFTVFELERTRLLIVILIVNLAITFPFNVFNSYISAKEKFVYQRILQLVKTIASPLLAIPLILGGYQSSGIVVATVFVNMCINFLNMIYAYKKLNIKIIFQKFESAYTKEIVKFSSFIFINMLVDEINWNVDKMLLGGFGGTAAVAIYSLAGQINGYYKSVSTSVSNVFAPQIHRMALEEDGVALTKLFTRVGRIQFMLLEAVFLAICFWGKYFIIIWAGKSYEDAFPILLILMFSVTIPLIQNLGIEIQRAKNMHQFRSIAYLIMAVLNVGISIPLCMKYHGIGCAIGTAVSLLLGNGLLMNWYYYRKLKLDIRYFWKEIMKVIPALLIPIGYGGIVSVLFPVHNFITFIVELGLFLILYILSMFMLGLNMEEKQMVYRTFRKQKG